MKEADLLDSIGWGANSGYYWETVYRTNTISAFNAGRAKAIEEMKPEYLEFVGIEDSRQSSICASCSQVVLPKDHPFWNSHYPPLHFNCRSTIRPVFKEEIEEGITTPSKGAPTVYTEKGFGKYPLGDGGSWDKVTDDLLRKYNVFMFETKLSKRSYSAAKFWDEPILKRYEEKYQHFLKTRKSPIFKEVSEKEGSLITFYTSAETHMVINDYIRLRVEKRIRKNPFLDRVVKELNIALKKLPPFKGLSFRGQEGWKGLGELAVGSNFTTPSFFSSSKDAPFKEAIQIKILGNSGRDISAFSFFPEETEILFPLKSQFRIINVDKKGENIIMKVEEITR